MVSDETLAVSSRQSRCDFPEWRRPSQIYLFGIIIFFEMCGALYLWLKELVILRSNRSPNFLKKWTNPGLFFGYFRFLKTIQINVNISIQYTVQDLNPRPFEHESSPITTRPGLPLKRILKFYLYFLIVGSLIV